MALHLRHLYRDSTKTENAFVLAILYEDNLYI